MKCTSAHWNDTRKIGKCLSQTVDDSLDYKLNYRSEMVIVTDISSYWSVVRSLLLNVSESCMHIA